MQIYVFRVTLGGVFSEMFVLRDSFLSNVFVIFFKNLGFIAPARGLNHSFLLGIFLTSYIFELNKDFLLFDKHVGRIA